YVVAEYQNKKIKDNIDTAASMGLIEQLNTTKSNNPIRLQLPQDPLYPPYTYAPVFYPSTGDFRQAQPLTLNPGDEVLANFILFSAPLVTIRGRVTNGMTGAPASMASVAAFWTEYMGGEGLPVRLFPQDGTFEIKGVAPGMYMVRAN